MKTEKEIKERKEQDIQFIISAVTSELHDIAYLNYFDAWENNGGMGWFFTECVEITHKIMLTEGSQYLKWLDYWTNTDEEHPQMFSEFTGETCFDWYHMNESRKEFESRYEKDECTKEQISESIGYIINSFDSAADRDEVMVMAAKFAKKNREAKEKREKLQLENKKKKFDKIINDLKELGVDGESMQHIIEEVGMEDQMHRQLIMTSSAESTEALLDELKELK